MIVKLVILVRGVNVRVPFVAELASNIANGIIKLPTKPQNAIESSSKRNRASCHVAHLVSKIQIKSCIHFAWSLVWQLNDREFLDVKNLCLPYSLLIYHYPDCFYLRFICLYISLLLVRIHFDIWLVLINRWFEDHLHDQCSIDCVLCLQLDKIGYFQKTKRIFQMILCAIRPHITHHGASVRQIVRIPMKKLVHEQGHWNLIENSTKNVR